jgi:acyl-coenzyme A synthetase/AMP-(fatty) acid ligase
LIALIGHPYATSIVAWRDGVAVTATEFLNDVRLLTAILPEHRHILNDCQDRYRFVVALCAILVAGKINLLPSTRTAETIRQLRAFAPDANCLTDQPDCEIDLPRIAYPDPSFFDNAGDDALSIPRIAETQLVAYVFTSGSTDLPIPHPKTWGSLVRNVQLEALQIGLQPSGSYNVMGTVPPQHMYGFESTVLMPLINGFSIVSAESFYPADICHALQQLPEPRILVTTPVHLRSLLGAGIVLPKVALIMSATAPLSPQIALQAEQTFDAPLREIYGSTETGQIATRRPTVSPEWTLFPDLKMARHEEINTHGEQDQRMWISGGHVAEPTPMNDILELTKNDCFLLHGRMSDLINIAGKRSSLTYLNHQLNAIPGVQDGAFYMPPDNARGEVTRLAAFVVAPELQLDDIITMLRPKIDSAFLPRPLYKVAQLPRNATGKLPQAALSELMHKLASTNERGAQA